jgi:hypothetical protein
MRSVPISGSKTLTVPSRRQENGPFSMLTSESMAENGLSQSETIIEKGRHQKDSTSMGEG